MAVTIQPSAESGARASPDAATSPSTRRASGPSSLLTSRGRVVAGESTVGGCPREWICFDESALSPVVDKVSRHLFDAGDALRRKDEEAAARELRLVAAELKLQAAAVAKRAGAAACADWTLAEFGSWRLASVSARLDATAESIRCHRLGCRGGLNSLIDGSDWTDLERRWLAADESLWYPVCGEPQLHFEDAVEAYSRQNSSKAVIEVHKAMGYLRLEVGRAGGYVRRVLDGAVAELGKVALSVASGLSRGREALGRSFSIADLALALAHRVKAAEWWALDRHRTAGYELQAAARCLEGAALWVQRGAAPGAIRAAALAERLGEGLAGGESASQRQVAEGLALFSTAVDALGSRIKLN